MGVYSFPMNDAQRSIAATMVAADDNYYDLHQIRHFPGGLDRDAVRRGYERVSSDHEMLRARFDLAAATTRVTGTGAPVCYAGKFSTFNEAHAAAEQHVRRPLNVERNHAVRMWMADIAGGGSLLTLLGHHLAFDEISFDLTWAALGRAVSGRSDDTITAARYSTADLTGTPGGHPALSLAWNSNDYAALRRLRGRAATSVGAADVCLVSRQGAWVDALPAIARRLDASSYVVAAAVFMRAAADVLGCEQLLLGTSESGRRRAADFRCVGHFSNCLFLGAADVRTRPITSLVAELAPALRVWLASRRVQWDRLIQSSGHADAFAIKFGLAREPSDRRAGEWGRTSSVVPGVTVPEVARRPLDVEVVVRPGEILMSAVSRKDCLEEEQVAQMLHGTMDGLEQLVVSS